MYFAYLDEFGHVAPYAGRIGPKYSESPVFGLAGFLLPDHEVRAFASWFYKLKSRLLAWEIERSGQPAYLFEKKGAQLFTTENIRRYPELRKATFRLLNHLHAIGGHIVYVGMEKYAAPAEHDAKSLYLAVLRESIKRIDQFCGSQDSNWFCVLDEQERSQFRSQIVSTAMVSMFGSEQRNRLIEPPIHAESHLFQTLQCADWLCGLIGRLCAYLASPAEYPELDWTARYFQRRLNNLAPFSSLRRRPDPVGLQS